MESLTKEQMEELNEIARLPKKEQQEKLQEFLSQLTPEQVEYLQKNQGQQCPFCLINEGKIDTKIVYQDDYLIAVLDINPAGLGHILVFPRIHYANSFEMSEDEFKHLMNTTNLIAKKIIEIVKAEGINIFLANGAVAGQRVPHLIVHIIPRFKDDGINLTWEPKKISEDKLKKIWQSFSDFQVKKIEKIEKKKKTSFKYKEPERIP